MTGLIAAQRSLQRALPASVYRAAGAQIAGRLGHPHRNRPGKSPALNVLLGHPHVRVWAVNCLQQLTPFPAGGPDRPGADQAPGTPDLAAGLGGGRTLHGHGRTWHGSGHGHRRRGHHPGG